MFLGQLPFELVEAVASCLESVTAISALSRTCHRFNTILGPFLYRYDDSRYSSLIGGDAMRWAIEQDSHETVRRVVDMAPEVLKAHSITSATNHGRLAIFETLIRVERIRKTLIDSGGMDERGENPLCVAATLGLEAFVLSLAEVSGADINHMMQLGTSPGDSWQSHDPLAVALHNGELGVAKILISCGVDVKYRPNSRFSPLVQSIYWNHLDLVRSILERGAGPVLEQEALPRAAKYGFVDIVRLLLEHGAKPRNASLPGGQNILCGAAGKDLDPQENAARAETARALLQYGADPSARCSDVAGGCLPLNSFVRQGNVEAAKILLDHGADSNAVDGTLAWTPVHCAVASGSIDMVKLLVEETRADCHRRDRQDMTPLHYAGSADMARYLVEEIGVDMNAISSLGETLLLTTLRPLPILAHSTSALAEYLIQRGIDVHISDREAGRTALHEMARLGDDTLVEMLLERNADPRTTDERGWSPLHCAAFTGRSVEVVELLVSYGAEVDGASDDGGTPAAYAVSRCPRIAETLIVNHGSSIHTEFGNPKRTMLHWAARVQLSEQRGDREAQISLFEALLAKGGDVNALDRRHQTPLYLLISEGGGDVERLRLLLAHGADPHIAGGNGGQPFCMAVCGKQMGAMELLLEHGCDVNTRTNTPQSLTLLMQVSMLGFTTSVEWLIRHGADVNAMSDAGESVLDVVRRSRSRNVAELLRSYGALSCHD